MRALFITVLLIWIHILEGATKTCDSIDIRNNVTELEKLKDCTVIVGYLEILLIETTTSFDDYTFPKLKEITEFLLFYRVNNLSSIGKLFPNLAVIRGQNIFVNYALVIYEMRDLIEIGLYNLVRISRGSVRIEKNPNLHYIKTINWERITDNKDVDIFIENQTLVEQRIDCSPKCEYGCWYKDKCQRIIDPLHCHHECLDGCQGKNNNKCDVCRNFRDGELCVSTCSENRYSVAHLFKCIDKDECLEMGDEWFIFGTECLRICPPKFEKKNGTCTLCESFCPKVCNGSMIVNMLSLQEFKGCTNITGTLSIRLDTPIKNIEHELEDNLGNIEEITEYLKVFRSINIRNLTFFKNLRSIRGDRLEQNRYSLIIHENSNLQKLWDWDNFTLDIGNGTFSFHFNPKLCLSEIEKLANFSHLEEKYSDIDVSNHSNGDNFACTFIDIEVNVSKIYDNNVTLIWKPLSNQDKKQAIRYLIYYKEVDDDASILDEEETCGAQSWMITFVSRADNDTDVTFRWNITNLKTYTKYVYYVRTDYMLGGRSELQYFMTQSGDPSVPMNVRTEPVGDDAIRLSWEKPINLNGILSHYIIVGFIQEDDQEVIDYRNYCRVKPSNKFKKQTIMETTTTEAPIMNDNCTCRKETIIQVIQEEDFDAICTDLDKHMYNKPRGAHSGCGSYKYQVIPSNHKLQDEVVEQIIHKREDTTTMKSEDENNQIINGVYYNFERQATSDDTSYVIHQLKHYSIYILLLAACNVNQTMEPQCSSVVMVSQRTGQQEGADDIEDVTVSTVNYNADIGWFEPKYPNAVIVSYEIQYQNLNSENSKNITECITRKKHEYNKYKYRINNLHPGTYRVSVRAYSLAGPGNFSIHKTVIITPPPQTSSIMWLIVAFIFLIALGAAIVILYYRYKVRHKLDNMHLIANVNPDYAGYREDDWEMERDNVEMYQELGQGTFGQVYSGLIKDENVLCAIKTVNEKATMHDIMEFLNEASVMKSFNEAHHVVRLLGVVSRTPRPLVVMELMVRGDLKSFLRTTRDSSTSLTCLEMYRMAAEIADGMAYLAAKKFVHRDLAARNCMVSADRTVKIGDFGMTRDIYETDYYRKETHGLLPVRWMAPESLADGVFTSDSDVWSYGIVLWEIATLAEQPYQGLANEQVLQFVTAKGTLERPLQCPDLLYDIMEVCWKWNPSSRPLFTDVVEKLEMNVGQDFRLVSFYHSRDGEDYRMNKAEINKMRVNHMAAMAQGRVAAHWSRDAEEVHFHTEPAARSVNSIASLSCHSPPNDYSPFPLSTSAPRFGV